MPRCPRKEHRTTAVIAVVAIVAAVLLILWGRYELHNGVNHKAENAAAAARFATGFSP